MKLGIHLLRKTMDKIQKMREGKLRVVNGMDGWIKTASGLKFHIFHPSIKEVSLYDVAHSLSLLCRFNGHTPFLYTVGAHSIIGSYVCEPIFAKDFLMHDSTESFIGDMATPLKREMSEFKKVENNIYKTIAEKFKVSNPLPKEIKEMDKLMFMMEWVYLMSGKKPNGIELPMSKKRFMSIATLPPEKIERLFIKRFRELS
jgi:hypothetical protein